MYEHTVLSNIINNYEKAAINNIINLTKNNYYYNYHNNNNRFYFFVTYTLLFTDAKCIEDMISVLLDNVLVHTLKGIIDEVKNDINTGEIYNDIFKGYIDNLTYYKNALFTNDNVAKIKNRILQSPFVKINNGKITDITLISYIYKTTNITEHYTYYQSIQYINAMVYNKEKYNITPTDEHNYICLLSLLPKEHFKELFDKIEHTKEIIQTVFASRTNDLITELFNDGIFEFTTENLYYSFSRFNQLKLIAKNDLEFYVDLYKKYSPNKILLKSDIEDYLNPLNDSFNILCDRSYFPKFFINNGYKLTKKDVIIAIKNKVAILNIEEHGILIDNDIADVSRKYKFDPYNVKHLYNINPYLTYPIEKMTPELICKHKTPQEIESYYESGSKIPNEECINTIIERKLSDILMLWIHKFNIIVNEKLIVNINKHFMQNEANTLINIFLSQQQNKIKDLEEKVDKLKKELITEKSKKVIKINNIKKPTIIHKTSRNLNGTIVNIKYF